MEDTTISIIEQWKEETGYMKSILADSIQVKHVDHKAEIYTVYLMLNPTIRIKAILNGSAWKIIELK
jgi:hypothetical protein